MSKLFIARPYRYADGVPWNEDRYEIFVKDNGQWVSIGGAIRRWDKRTVAFICTKGAQRWIRTPLQAEQETNGLYVWGNSVREALLTLKWKYPDPTETLHEAVALANASF